jgi:hypothetical protein
VTDQPIRRQAGSEATPKEDLVSWLTAQLDHDEQVAQTVADRYLDVRDGRPYWPLPSVEARFRDAQPAIRAGLDLIKLHDPARVLRQVAAYRRILSRHEGLHRCEGGDFDGGPYGPCEPARDLASIYSDRSGFDPSWTVE